MGEDSYYQEITISDEGSGGDETPMFRKLIGTQQPLWFTFVSDDGAWQGILQDDGSYAVEERGRLTLAGEAARIRVCAGCGVSLRGKRPHAKTCGALCRQRVFRARRRVS